MTDGSPDRGFVVTVSPVGTATLPSWSAADRRHHHPPLQQQIPTALKYASTACVDAHRHGDPLRSPPSTSHGRNGPPPPVLRKPAGGYPGDGCHDSACRLLGNEDGSGDWGAETTLDETPYSCADMSAALRDVETPLTGHHQPVDTTTSTLNPHQLCDEIDELFFKA